MGWSLFMSAYGAVPGRGERLLIIGDWQTGYIVVPSAAEIHAELDARCKKTDREPLEWIRPFQVPTMKPLRVHFHIRQSPFIESGDIAATLRIVFTPQGEGSRRHYGETTR
jgi:hypothetical protein